MLHTALLDVGDMEDRTRAFRGNSPIDENVIKCLIRCLSGGQIAIKCPLVAPDPQISASGLTAGTYIRDVPSAAL